MSEPEPRLYHRRLFLPGGKMLGGCAELVLARRREHVRADNEPVVGVKHPIKI
jgi:hypothetical protein